MKKTLYIVCLLLIIGFTATSCKKEKTCECKYERTYAGDENVYTFNLEVKIDKGSCEDISGYSTTDRAGLTFTTTTSCKEKE